MSTYPRISTMRAAGLWLPVLLLVAALPGAPAALAAQASLVSAPGGGYGDEPGTLSTTDDGSFAVSIETAFPSGILLAGTAYDSLFIGTNGYVTFGHPNSSFQPEGIAGYSAGPIIAPQFDDLNPGNGGTVHYFEVAPDAGRAGYIVVTWDAVAPYESPPVTGSGTNSFQVVLRQIGDATDFEMEIRYGALNWAGGFPGSADVSTAGWSFGDQATYSELDYSGTSLFLNTLYGSNVAEPGVYRWNVVGGQVESTPTVTATASPTAGTLSHSSVELGGTVGNDGGSTVIERGIVYSTTSAPTTEDGSTSNGSGTGSFTSSLTGLVPSTAYYARAYATNVLGTGYGPQITFTTAEAPATATVTTGPVTAVSGTGAAFAGEVTDEGGSAVAERGVVYATTTAPTLADHAVASGSGVGPFSATASDLTPATTYWVRAYATNDAGTEYGAEASFTTEAVVPSVAAVAVSAVTSSGATIDGEVTATGGASVTARGVVYTTTAAPTLAADVATSGTGAGTFSADLAGLDPGTTYYVRGYATNSEGTSYGAEASFTTVGVLPTVATGAVNDVTTDGARVAAEVTDDGGLTVSARGVVYATSQGPTLSNESVPNGTGTGAFSAVLSGLEPGTTYYARAYATNAIGTSYGDEVTVEVARLAQTISFSALDDRGYGDAPVVLGATASSGLAVMFTTSDAGVAAVQDGELVITGAGDATITAAQPGNATYLAAPSVERTIAVAPRAVTGSFTIQDPKEYDAKTEANVIGRSLAGALVADEGSVSLVGGEAHFADAELGTGKTATLTGATLSGPRAAHYVLTGVEDTTGSIVTGAPHTVRLEGPSRLVAGEPGTYTLTLLDAYGNPTTTSDALGFDVATSLVDGVGVFEPASLALAAGGSAAVFSYTSTRAADEPETISLDQSSGAPLAGGTPPTVASTVSAAGVDHFEVELDESVSGDGATVGDPVSVRVTARDAFGNVVPSFEGTVAMAADTEVTDGAGTTGAFTSGVLTAHEVVVGAAGSTTLMVTAEIDGRTVTGHSASFDTRFEDAQLSIAIGTEQERPALGSELTLRIVVTNEGWAVAGNVVIDDPLANQDRLEAIELTVDVGSVDEDTGEWRIDTLASGASATMTIRARVIEP